MNKIRKATFAALAVSMLAGGAAQAIVAIAGVGLLYPELRRTNRGRAFVMRNFDRNRAG